MALLKSIQTAPWLSSLLLMQAPKTQPYFPSSQELTLHSLSFVKPLRSSLAMEWEVRLSKLSFLGVHKGQNIAPFCSKIFFLITTGL